MDTTRIGQIELPMGKIEDFCQRWNILELALFGSVLRDDFRSDSDIDVLVTFAPNSQISFADFLQAEGELAQLLRREVDLVSRQAVENSRNYIIRKHILKSARVIYVA